MGARNSTPHICIDPELKVPNAKTRAAMMEAAEIMRSKKLRFRNAEEVLADLDKTSAR